MVIAKVVIFLLFVVSSQANPFPKDFKNGGSKLCKGNKTDPDKDDPELCQVNILNISKLKAQILTFFVL